MERFQDKVILVTGATSGIGRGTALMMAQEGAAVVLAGRREKEGNEIAARIQEQGGKATFVASDVTREADHVKLVETALREYGRLDGAFNNAGSGKPGSIVEYTEEDFDREIAVNLKSVWLGMKHQIPAIARSGGGAIVNTASQGAIVGVANYGPYGAAKGGVLSISRAAAAEVAGQKIRVNSISPGAVNTELWANAPEGMLDAVAAGIPLKRVAEPADIAALVAYLLSDGASWVTGQNIVIDGGSTSVIAQG
ncbi:MAG: SDR family NAD(P)-dependent oxidoreductase [Armatimonadaceae bacterium]